MNTRCACFAVNVDYLFPAVASAVQLRALLAPVYDILVFGIDMDASTARDFGPICAANNIVLKHVSSTVLDGMSGLYASMFLDRFVPDEYSHFLYVDADVQFWRPVGPLFEMDVPRDGFLVVADPMTFEIFDSGQRPDQLRAYMGSIGLDEREFPKYFNSGVMYINRRGWSRLCNESLRFLETRPELCRFSDQSAMNAVSAGRHTMMSLRWNFPTFLRNCKLDTVLDPAIFHFMSRPKPWQGSFPPWNSTFTSPYSNLLRSQPHLTPYAERTPSLTRVRYLAQQWIKRGYESVSWSFGKKRDAIRDYEESIAIPLKM